MTRTSIFPLALAAMAAAAVILPSPASRAAGVAAYMAVHIPYRSGGAAMVAARRFERDGRVEYLSFDPASLASSIVASTEVEGAGRLTDEEIASYPLMRALRGGEAQAAPKGGGTFLTADLCPSKKPLDKALFEAASSLGGGRPAPVAIAVSGTWIKRHRDGLDWLLGMEELGRLDITWVNHSYSHPYKGGEVKAEEDFLLTPGVDFEAEVLRNEALMIEAGLTPSPFFRFPGLVSSPDLVKRLKALDLVPLGADAWLAKGQTPALGSVILVHGNGNEPDGTRRLLSLYEGGREAFMPGGRLAHRPLREAYSGGGAVRARP